MGSLVPSAARGLGRLCKRFEFFLVVAQRLIRNYDAARHCYTKEVRIQPASIANAL